MNLIKRGLNGSTQESIYQLTKLRFLDRRKFKTPEALVCYEMGLWSLEEAIKYCSEEYTEVLNPIILSYVEPVMAQKFAGSMFIPAKIDTNGRELILYTLPEVEENEFDFTEFELFKRTIYKTDICSWVDSYTKLLGKPNFLLPLPEKDILHFIVREAISHKVMDTTISSGGNGGNIYHLINLVEYRSAIKIDNSQVEELARILCHLAKNSMDMSNRKSKRIAVNYDDSYRLRIEITPNYYGYMISMRLLPNKWFDYSLEAINLQAKTIAFIRRYNQNMNIRGARLMAGPTGSGKNTTQFSDLKEILERKPIKAVSVEQPVELLMKGMEQLNADTEELYKDYSESLIRHNPGLVYISEITDKTAIQFMKVANTGKVVYSTVHTNSAATVFSRLVDLTGLSIDRVLQDIVVCMYQTLIPDEEYGVRPVNSCIYFSRELKNKCIGKSLGEILIILQEEEDRWHTLTEEDILNGVLD